MKTVTPSRAASLFAELEEGMQALKAHREGKLTLREHTVLPHGDSTGGETEEITTVDVEQIEE